jgi:poly(3-hydroxyalkanoate) synthetase
MLSPANDGIAPQQPVLDWPTDHVIAAELPTMRLREFSPGRSGHATMICAPFALHGASVADFAPGHSLVERLCREGERRLFVTDWRSATPEMRHFSIDTYLEDLNVAVDDCEPPVDVIGLCQGGWLALAYAARFPGKVRKLVLAGAPIDIEAGRSPLSEIAQATPFSTFEEYVALGGGRMRGSFLLNSWVAQLGAQEEADRVLQVVDPQAESSRELRERFKRWSSTTVDLPGAYYLEVVQRIFKENQLARGKFVALGHTINLADVRLPLFLLAASADEVVQVDQLFATAHLVGTSSDQIVKLEDTCGHLSLFMGSRSLSHTWPAVARWLDC